LLKTRGKYGQDISTEDIKIAINKLKQLGTGIEIHGVGDNQIIQSVPGELNMDHTMVLELAQKVKDEKFIKIFSLNLFFIKE